MSGFRSIAKSVWKTVTGGISYVNGMVGIGKVPTETLDIQQPADDGGMIIRGYDDVSGEFLTFYLNSAGASRIVGTNQLQINNAAKFDVNDVEFLGKLGIGRIPTETLDIQQPADDAGMTIRGYDDQAGESGNLCIDENGCIKLVGTKNVFLSGHGVDHLICTLNYTEIYDDLWLDGDRIKMTGITEAERDGLTPVAGDIIYNTTENKHQGYDGTSWNNMY